MTFDSELKQLRRMNEEISATSSSTEKRAILAKYPDMKQILLYTYHPLMKYNMTSANVIKRKPDFIRSRRTAIMTRSPYTSLYTLLESLHLRKITGVEALDSVLQFIEQYPDYEAEILNIIDKDLKIRIDASTINKVFKNLIPTFDVALANDYWKVADRVDFKKDTWFASRKIDGCLHASTRLEFSTGEIYTIQDIVENRIEGKVKSFDVHTEEIVYRSIVNHFKNTADIQQETDEYQWYEITLSDNSTLTLTGNHRVWLPDICAWRRVDELQEGQHLLIDDTTTN